MAKKGVYGMFLSFVVPVYNAAQYLPECLDSLLAQDISDYEIICVNDGSRDASPEILRQYAAEHGNIRVINKENGGVVSARNAGLSSAQGDYIWFVDADDFLLPNILGFLKGKAAETACDRLIVGGYQFTDRLTDEEIALSRQMKLPINSQWYDSVVWRSLLRREFLLENGLNFRYPELTHGEDGLYMYEVGLCAPKSVEIKLALYCYREHSGSAETTVSLENYHKKIRSYIRISEILLGYYRGGRQDPTTADKLMVFLWFTLYVTASLPRKDAAAVLRQLRQKGLYPFHRPPQCTLTHAYMTRQTGCVGTFLDWLCRHPAHPLGLLPDVAPAAPRAVEASLSRPGEKRLAYQNHTFSGCNFPADGV